MMTSCLAFVLVFIVVYKDCLSCNFTLVTGPHGVPDEAITASSSHSHCMTDTARIDSVSAWCPATVVDDHYLQVKFQNDSLVKAIITYARKNYLSQHAPFYKANTSMDGLTWSFLTDETGNVELFTGNTANLEAKVNTVHGNVVARYIRIMPEGYSTFPSMRLEVLGCPVSCIKESKWKAIMGEESDVLPVVLGTTTPNHGVCGKLCHNNALCDSFLFEMSSTLCQLFNSNATQGETVSLAGKWYFVKNNT